MQNFGQIDQVLWLRPFKRTQTTEINSFISDKEIVPCGVPQGSVLGPVLFLIFINDIPNSSQKLNFVLFADDTNMLYADKHPKSLEETVNKELKNVCKWLHVNKLTLNIKKSNFVIFRPPQRSLNYEIKLKVIDNSTNISSSLECKEYVKYLGVLIDNHLSWKYHVDYIAVKIKPGFHMSGKSQTIGDFTFCRPSQILPIYQIFDRGLSQIFERRQLSRHVYM